MSLYTAVKVDAVTMRSWKLMSEHKHTRIRWQFKLLTIDWSNLAFNLFIIDIWVEGYLVRTLCLEVRLIFWQDVLWSATSPHPIRSMLTTTFLYLLRPHTYLPHPFLTPPLPLSHRVVPSADRCCVWMLDFFLTSPALTLLLLHLQLPVQPHPNQVAVVIERDCQEVPSIVLYAVRGMDGCSWTSGVMESSPKPGSQWMTIISNMK